MGPDFARVTKGSKFAYDESPIEGAMPPVPNRSFQFGAFELDERSGELRKHGLRVKLQDQPLQVLILLLDRAGSLVTREEIRDVLWPGGTFVDFDSAISSAVWKLREALGDSSESPRFIETVARRGYRFLAPVSKRGEIAPPEGIAPAGLPASAEVATVEPAATHPTAKPRLHSLRFRAAFAVLAAAVVLAALFLFNRPHKAAEHASLHVASHARDLTISRDGKLIAYISAVAGGLPHVWVRQTSGGNDIQATGGPEPDRMPDLSPDGTQIAFVSTRGGGGIYLAPSFGGEPKRIVRDGFNPRYSPDGTSILYWDGQRRVFTVPADGGPPVRVDALRNFRVYTAPCWSPDGTEVIFNGVAGRGSEDTRKWWIVPLHRGTPRLAPLPGVERDQGLFPAVRDWSRTKDGREWILYSIQTGEDWSLLRSEMYEPGQAGRGAEVLASAAGELGQNSRLSVDGRLVYNTLVLGGSIYWIPTTGNGERTGSAEPFPIPEELNCHSPSVSRDGRWMVYTTSAPGKPNTVLIRDLQNGTERLLDDKAGGPDRGTNAISPDGSTVIIGRACKEGVCAFVISPAGAEPEELCTGCAPRGFSPDGSTVLLESYALPGEGRDRIVAFDLHAKKQKNFLSDPDHSLRQASFSWDGRWVVFRRDLGGTSQIVLAPVLQAKGGKQNQWIPITDGRYVDDKPSFSPDGRIVYFLSSRDGHTCIWKQELNPVTKHPTGAPVAYEHMHANSFDFFRQRRTELSVAADKLVIGVPEIYSDLWIKQVN